MRAARPDEDVFCGVHDALEALRRGFPRLVVTWEGEDLAALRRSAGPDVQQVPALVFLRPDRLRTAAHERLKSVEFAVLGVDDRPGRLRALLRTTAARSFADEILDSFALETGAPLPAPFSGFARRVLEYPAHYPTLQGLGALAGLSSGALKARFRRRGLPSPFAYLRWLRILAAGRLLSANPGMSIAGAALRLGFSSGANLCRAVTSVTGKSPSALRSRGALYGLTRRFAGEYLTAERLALWDELGPLFLRGAA